MQAEPRLAPVVERLERERHEDVAAVLEDVDRALVAMVSGAGGVADVRRAVGTLSSVLLAHLGYGECQLVGPLNRLSIGI